MTKLGLQPENMYERLGARRHSFAWKRLQTVVIRQALGTSSLRSVAVKFTELNRGEIVLYRTDDGKTALDVRLEAETVWLTQAQIAKLFQRERSVVTKHIRNVFLERELTEKGNVQKMHIANSDKPVAYFSLDVIISVGYRVKSKHGTQFRIWATQTLRDHLVRGYTLNERRLRERSIDIEQAVQFLSRTLTQHNLVTAAGREQTHRLVPLYPVSPRERIHE